MKWHDEQSASGYFQQIQGISRVLVFQFPRLDLNADMIWHDEKSVVWFAAPTGFGIWKGRSATHWNNGVAKLSKLWDSKWLEKSIFWAKPNQPFEVQIVGFFHRFKNFVVANVYHMGFNTVCVKTQRTYDRLGDICNFLAAARPTLDICISCTEMIVQTIEIRIKTYQNKLDW